MLKFSATGWRQGLGAHGSKKVNEVECALPWPGEKWRRQGGREARVEGGGREGEVSSGGSSVCNERRRNCNLTLLWDACIQDGIVQGVVCLDVVFEGMLLVHVRGQVAFDALCFSPHRFDHVNLQQQVA